MEMDGLIPYKLLHNKADLGPDGKIKPEQLPEAQDYIPLTEKGMPNGVAELDSTGKVPNGQLPAMDYIQTAQKGAAGGVATLDSTGKVPGSQLPEMDYIQTAEKGATGGVATLNESGQVPNAQLPPLDYVPTSQKGVAGGVASLDANGKVPSAELPSMDYIQTSEKGSANGVASLDSNGQLQASQLPAITHPVSSVNGMTGAVRVGYKKGDTIILNQYEVFSGMKTNAANLQFFIPVFLADNVTGCTVSGTFRTHCHTGIIMPTASTAGGTLNLSNVTHSQVICGRHGVRLQLTAASNWYTANATTNITQNTPCILRAYDLRITLT